MSIFNWIGGLFEPAAKLIDDLNYSGEEKGEHEIKKKQIAFELRKIESQVATRTLELQSQIIEANQKIAVAEQQSGNWLSKSWRPLCSVGSFVMLSLMGLEKIPFNAFLAGVYGSFLGIYTGARSWEKKK